MNSFEKLLNHKNMHKNETYLLTHFILCYEPKKLKFWKILKYKKFRLEVSAPHSTYIFFSTHVCDDRHVTAEGFLFLVQVVNILCSPHSRYVFKTGSMITKNCNLYFTKKMLYMFLKRWNFLKNKKLKV